MPVWKILARPERPKGAGEMTDGVRAFLEGRGRDGAGRTFEAVIALDDAAMEANHDFIQWLFPLTEPSRAVPGSPVLSPDDLAALRASPAAQANLQRAVSRMGRFYADTGAWLGPHDHNHLRISRIIRSLRLLQGDAAANAFRQRILEAQAARGGRINAQSLAFWARA